MAEAPSPAVSVRPDWHAKPWIGGLEKFLQAAMAAGDVEEGASMQHQIRAASALIRCATSASIGL